MKRALLALFTVVSLSAGLTGVAAATEPSTAAADLTPLAGPDADQLRDAVTGCHNQLSNGLYSQDAGGSRTIPVCESAGGAVHWKADFDVDCDGQRTTECNESTDPSFLNETAFPESDGDPLNSAVLPHVVVPLPSSVWDYRSAGIAGGTVAAAVYQDRVVYAVVGDLGPASIIGEGSYALAEALGIDPDPASGGIGGRVVDFILFPGVKASPIENHSVAVGLGEQAATELVNGCGSYSFSAYPTLTAGTSGAEVKAAQCLLADAGFPTGSGAPTGVFDPATVTATEQFQTSVGLAATGTVDSHTWTALLARGDTPTLRNGSTGAAVTRLQRALTAALGRTIAQDGDFGPLTEQAVEDYQSSRDLSADGIVGPITWGALQAGD